MQLGVARSLERWAATWARRRQGADAHAIALKRRRIYILPTRFGVVFAAMVFAMLLGSLNYAASLGFALTFLLAGLCFVVMHHCHNNLLGATIKFVGAAPVFAGERAEFKVAVGNDAAAARFEIELKYREHTAGPVDVADGATEVLRIGLPTEHRGWVALDRFRVETRYPARLFRAWTWVHMDTRCLVYPRPAAPGRPLPDGTGGGVRGRPHPGDDDFAGLRSAAPGDPPQRIAWKAYARNDHLLLKEFSSGTGEPCLLAWDLLPELGVEQRLSQLARWCLDADAAGRGIALRLPGQDIPPGSGRSISPCVSRRWPCSTRAWMPAVEQRRRGQGARGRATQGAVAESSCRAAAMTAAFAMRRPDLSLESKRLLWTAAIVVGTSLPHWPTLAAWMPVLLLTAIGWRFGIELYRWPTPPRPVRLALAVGAFCAVLLQYRTLNGVEAGSALLVVMVALKFLESRDQRDQLVLIMISYFLMFASLLSERGPLVAAYVILLVWLTTVALIQIGRRGEFLSYRTTGALSGRLLLHALPLMAALFMLFPRLPGPLWAIPGRHEQRRHRVERHDEPGRHHQPRPLR